MKGQQQPSPSWSAAAGHTARLPGSAWECWSLWALCSPWALFHCAPWHQVAVAGKKKEMLFSKCCGMRLNASQLNTENITKSTRANNQVGGGVQRALCAASTWPERFVVSSLSLVLVIVPQHLWFICYFLVCFVWWGWYCEAVLKVKHHPSLMSCQYQQWPLASGGRINSGQGRQSLNS